jgi:hypothetical protein
MKDYDKVDIELHLRSISYDLESYDLKSDYLDGLEAERERILAPRASKPSSGADLKAEHQSYEVPHRDEAVSARLFALPERAKIRRARQRRLRAWRISLLTTTIHQQFRVRTTRQLTRS